MKLHADLVILGGGMAGMTLALQVRRRMANLRILILERNTFPVEESAYKVGESTVEVAAHYFANVLGLAKHLEQEHLPKLGQRFFWSDGHNADITSRLEFGCRDFPAADTYQIARGRFENHLAELCTRERIELLDGVTIDDIKLGAGSDDHSVTTQLGGHAGQVTCRWLVDASGGASLIKRNKQLRRDVDHHVSSAWFRVAREVKIDDWSQCAQWQQRHGDGPQRRLSVNHLMGRGYWIWAIPLATGSTSIGLVADERLHPVSGYNSFEKLKGWMDTHEPQCASILRNAEPDLEDFGVMKNFSRHSTRVYSPDRWFITGIAGVFVDPFYSPGSDFIAYGNTFITDLIVADHAGREDVPARIEAANQFFLRLTDAYFEIFEDKYRIFGNQQVMPLKVCWDWSSYWTYNAFVFCHGAFGQLPYDPDAQRLLQSFAALNHQMQRFFSDWDQAETPSTAEREYIDWTQCEFLASLNQRLVDTSFDENPLDALQNGFDRLSAAAGELVAAGIQRVPGLAPYAKHVTMTQTRECYGYILNKVGL